MNEMVKGGIYSPSFNFVGGVVILLAVRMCACHTNASLFLGGDWWTSRNFYLKLRMRTKNCRMRISGGKTVRLVKAMM